MIKRISVVVLLVAMMLSAFSCVKPVETGSDETTDPNVTTVQTTVVTTQNPEYEYPEMNFGKERFIFLNVDENRWNMHTTLDCDSDASNTELDDAIYRRNIFIEDLYKIDIEVINEDIYKTCDFVSQQAKVNDDSADNVDAAYCYGGAIAPLISQGFISDLSKIDSINLDQPWWNQNVRENSVIGENDSLYYALSDLSLTGFDLTWCMMFNTQIADAINLPNLYETVLEKNWTIGKLNEYAMLGMDLKGDNDFEYSSQNKAIYGFTTYDNFVIGAMHGSECFMTKRNEEGTPVFALNDDRFYNFASSYANLVIPGNLVSHNGGADGNYEDLFQANRALFVGAEVKATGRFKKNGVEYGLIPVPKYDNKQEKYYSNINYLVPLLAIPVTNKNLENTGVILDALSYMSYKDVLPIYYGITLSMKNLTDEQSIGMLDIIRDGRSFEASLSYGWTTDFFDQLKQNLIRGNAKVSNVVVSAEEVVNDKINLMS